MRLAVLLLAVATTDALCGLAQLAAVALYARECILGGQIVEHAQCARTCKRSLTFVTGRAAVHIDRIACSDALFDGSHCFAQRFNVI